MVLTLGYASPSGMSLGDITGKEQTWQEYGDCLVSMMNLTKRSLAVDFTKEQVKRFADVRRYRSPEQPGVVPG